MYEVLVRHLQEDMDAAMRNGDDDFWRGWIAEAADAIEELSAHYCPHMIRNVHDRGDDSLCRVLMTEPLGTEQWNYQAWLDWLKHEYNESEVNNRNAENATSTANDTNDPDNSAMLGPQESNHI